MTTFHHNSSQNNDDQRKFNAKRRKIEPPRKAPQTERGLTHSPYFNGPLYQRMSEDLHLGGMSVNGWRLEAEGSKDAEFRADVALEQCLPQAYSLQPMPFRRGRRWLR